MKRKANNQGGPAPKRRRLFRRKARVFARVPRGVRTGLNIPRIQKHRYVTNVAIDPGAGTIATYNISANDMFDPDKSGTGHQPMRYDQMAAFYNHYVVLGSRISVVKVGTLATSATSLGVVWGVFLNDSTVSPTSYSTMIEQGRTSYKLGNTTNAMVNSKCVRKFSAKKFFNVKDVKDNADRLGAHTGSSPTEHAVFTIWAQALDLSTDAPNQQYLATVDYITLWSEPADVPAS